MWGGSLFAYNRLRVNIVGRGKNSCKLLSMDFSKGIVSKVMTEVAIKNSSVKQLQLFKGPPNKFMLEAAKDFGKTSSIFFVFFGIFRNFFANYFYEYKCLGHKKAVHVKDYGTLVTKYYVTGNLKDQMAVEFFIYVIFNNSWSAIKLLEKMFTKAFN